MHLHGHSFAVLAIEKVNYIIIIIINPCVTSDNFLCKSVNLRLEESI